MNRKASKGIGVYIVILAMLMMTIYFAVSMMSDQEQPKYYEIISYFEEEQVQEFTLDVSSGEMSMRIQNDAGQTAIISYRVASVNMFYEDTKELIEAYNENHPDAPMKVDFIRPKDAPWWLQPAALSAFNWRDDFLMVYDDAPSRRRHRQSHELCQSEGPDSGRRQKNHFCRM